jgi:NitT/TauT family transport system substrate-binding protein
MGQMANRLTVVSPRSRLSRRQALQLAGGLGLSIAGMSLLPACGAGPATPAGALETQSLRIAISNAVSICQVPLWVAEPLLKKAGFTNVTYAPSTGTSLTVDAVASGQSDITLQFSGPSLLYLDAGKAITILAGVHVGCFVLFGSPNVRNIGDLRGKTLAISQFGGPDHVYLSSILANVNINPVTDVTWTTLPPPQTKQRFIDGQIDAILAFPPAAQELHDKQIGHIMANSMTDRPWSEYYCCMVTVNNDFLRKNPVATKAALSAILQATDICALHPEIPAKLVVDKGFAPAYQYALEAMQEIPYNRWRAYDPDDTVRFYGLLLRGVNMISKTPEQLIAQGTDWRFLNELKSELPALGGAQAATRTLLCAVDNERIAGAGHARQAQ